MTIKADECLNKWFKNNTSQVFHYIFTADFQCETFLEISDIYVEEPVTWNSVRAFVVYITSFHDFYSYYGLELDTSVYPIIDKYAIICASP